MYPISWLKNRYIIARSHNNRSETPVLDFGFTPARQRYSVTYGDSFGALLFSVTISDIEPSDAATYRCYDDVSFLGLNRDLNQTYIVSVTAKCLCRRPEDLADTVIVGDGKVRVNCSLQGYQSLHDDETIVNITLGNETIQGNMIENYIIANITASKFCRNLSMEFYLDPEYSSMVQCQVPRLDQCPFDMSTTFQGITLNRLQDQTSLARDEGTVLPPLSSSLISRIETHDTSSSLSNIILITSVATVVLIILVAIVLIVCFLKRRKRRSNPNKPYPTKESGTKTKGTDTDCGTGISPQASMDDTLATFNSSDLYVNYQRCTDSVLPEGKIKGPKDDTSTPFSHSDESLYVNYRPRTRNLPEGVHGGPEEDSEHDVDADDDEYLVPDVKDYVGNYLVPGSKQQGTGNVTSQKDEDEYMVPNVFD